MEENGDPRETENNWVIPNTEGLPVETVGFEHGEPLPSHEEVKPAGLEPAAVLEGEKTTEMQEVKGPESSPSQEPESPPPATEIPTHQERLDVSPEEPREESSQGLRKRLGGELEEVSCSSSDDDVEGLRKRVARGEPPTSIGPAPREAVQLEEENGFTLTVNKCIIAAVALVGLAVLVFTGGLGGEEDLPQTVITRSARGGDKQPETIADLQDWLHQHANQFSGDPNSLQVMSDLLDKVAKENQEIRHIQANLQAQKEELQTLAQGGEKVTPESQQFRLTEENVRLKEALLREETGHLSAKEELEALQEQVDTLEAEKVDKDALTAENDQLKSELAASKSQIEGFLTQKETLVAESQMLRQELDKQRSLVVTIRQDLDGMTSNLTEGVVEKGIKDHVTEISNRLAMEAQRSETWEKKYVEHAQKRKELVGEEKKAYGRKEWKKGDRWNKASDSTTPGEQVGKPHFKHGKEHGRRRTEDEQPESQHEEWKGRKFEDKQHWQEKKHRHWEGEKTKTENKERHPHESDGWKGKEGRWKDSPPHPESERHWKDKHSRHHHTEGGDGFHPRKGQKDFSEAHKHGEDKRREHGDKPKEHRHHDHNKFWKKLSDHQYRVPEGCSGLEDCARKDGIDLFNIDLKPVQRKQFEEILQNYLNKSDLSKHLPELVPLLDGFFEGPLFAHHKIRFKDFVDDVEDFLEDLARKETGSDDLVDDFERFVYINFFGEAAIKKKSEKKKGHRPSYKYDRQHNPEKVEESANSEFNKTDLNNNNKNDFKVDGDYQNYKPHKGKYKMDNRHKHGPPSHQYDQDGDDHGWKKQKHYDQGEKYHHKGHHETSERYFNQTKDSGQGRFKKSKNSNHNHGYRSFNVDYDTTEDEQKTFKKHEVHKDTHGHHNHKNKYDTEDHEHGNDYEHKQNWKKHEKDAINKYYRSSENGKHESNHYKNKPWKKVQGDHHDHKPLEECEDDSHEHKPWKKGDHHEHKSRKQGEGDHYKKRPWKEEGHREDKPWKQGDYHEQKSWKQGDHHEQKSWKQGDHHEQKPWKQDDHYKKRPWKEEDHHEQKPWKQGDQHEHKPWKQGEGDHDEQKPWKQGKVDHDKHKSWKQGKADHENKPWKQVEGDQHEHKPWKQGDHHEHKPWKQGDHDEHKPWKQDDHHEHKPWKQGDRQEQKPRKLGDNHEHKQWKQGDQHEHKPWKQGDHHNQKPWKQAEHHEEKPWKQGEDDHHDHKPWKDGDHKHGKPKHHEGSFDTSNQRNPSKPYYDKNDDKRQKPYHGKQDDSKERPYKDNKHGSHHDKYEDSKHDHRSDYKDRGKK